MKLAYSSNAYRRFPIAEAIERIATLGYQGMELMADAPHAWPADTTDRELHAIRDRLQAFDLRLSNVNAFMTTAIGDFWHPSWIEADPAARRSRLQHTVRALYLAAKLGAPSITTEPGGPLDAGISREQALDWFEEGLREALPHAEEAGVSLLVEPEPGLLVENAEQFLSLAGRIDSPMLGLNFDVGHFFCVGDPLESTIARLAKHTRHYHLEDIAATRVHEHLVPGQGAIDFAKVLAAVRNTGYDGWLTVELYPYLDDPDAAGQEARRILDKLLGPHEP